MSRGCAGRWPRCRCPRGRMGGPGWPYSFVAALEPGRTSWTRLLDAIRIGPDDDLAAVTAGQVRGVVHRLIAAGHWQGGDPDILVIFDAGYEPARLAWMLSDVPVQVIGRLAARLEPAAPQACPPRRLGKPPGQPPGQRGHPHPADRRPPAARAASQARVAVD